MITHRRACDIAGLELETVRKARRRHPELLLSEWFMSRSDGVDRSTILFLTTYARATAFGIPVQPAAEAAWVFTEFSDVATHCVADGSPSYVRGPAELYPEGRTFLVITRPLVGAKAGPLTGGFDARMVNLRWEETMADVLAKLGFFNSQGSPDVGIAALIDLNAVVEHVDAALTETRTPAQERADEIAEIEAAMTDCA